MTTRNAFPVGLYGTLLLAACWLLVPDLLRPVERALLGLACLPQRAFAVVSGTPAEAIEKDLGAQLASLAQDLERRSFADDVERARAFLPPVLEPLPCRVVEASREGGGGLPCELRLDRSYLDLAGCVDLVTCGDSLLGFVAQPGLGAALKDEPTDPARVLLLNHPESRQVAARLSLQNGQELRCVVGPAAVVDPAPMRTSLHDDPYRAAATAENGAELRTIALDAPWVAAMPKDLLLGRTRVWGYRVGDETLTIGVYVEPLRDPRALPQVVLWQSVPGSVPAKAQHQRTVAVATPLPDRRGQRWLVQGSGTLPDGAAVVKEGLCLGTLRGMAFGQGLCTPFPASRHPWSLWLLPDDPTAPPVSVYGEVVHANGSTAWFRPRSGFVAQGGFAFTGSNGKDCPAGLLLGRAEPDLERKLWRVTAPALDGPQSVLVLQAPTAEAR